MSRVARRASLVVCAHSLPCRARSLWVVCTRRGGCSRRGRGYVCHRMRGSVRVALPCGVVDGRISGCAEGEVVAATVAGAEERRGSGGGGALQQAVRSPSIPRMSMRCCMRARATVLSGRSLCNSDQWLPTVRSAVFRAAVARCTVLALHRVTPTTGGDAVTCWRAVVANGRLPRRRARGSAVARDGLALGAIHGHARAYPNASCAMTPG